MVCFSTLFTGNPKLELIVWERYDEVQHKLGMELLLDLTIGDQFRDISVTMLRPLGRNLRDSNHFYSRLSQNSAEEYGDIGQEGQDYFFPNAGERSSHCELWVHVADVNERQVWDRIVTFITANDFGKAWRQISNPIWEPLGQDESSTQYKQMTLQNEQRTYSSLSNTLRSALLKLIWHRGSLEICQLISSQSTFKYSPSKDWKHIIDVLDRILSPFDLMNYGLSTNSLRFDPVGSTCSHLPAFAVNALLEVETAFVPVINKQLYLNTLEQYTGNPSSTHPYLWLNKPAYLQGVENSLR